jgi:transposase
VSVAAVALTHGLNANLVRRWLQKRDANIASAVARVPVKLPAAAFVPVPVQSTAHTLDIRLELRRGGATVVVSWPAQEAAACGRWLKEWLG